MSCTTRLFRPRQAPGRRLEELEEASGAAELVGAEKWATACGASKLGLPALTGARAGPVCPPRTTLGTRRGISGVGSGRPQGRELRTRGRRWCAGADAQCGFWPALRPVCCICVWTGSAAERVGKGILCHACPIAAPHPCAPIRRTRACRSAQGRPLGAAGRTRCPLFCPARSERQRRPQAAPRWRHHAFAQPAGRQRHSRRSLHGSAFVASVRPCAPAPCSCLPLCSCAHPSPGSYMPPTEGSTAVPRPARHLRSLQTCPATGGCLQLGVCRSGAGMPAAREKHT
jgi:hypothetical protein